MKSLATLWISLLVATGGCGALSGSFTGQVPLDNVSVIVKIPPQYRNSTDAQRTKNALIALLTNRSDRIQVIDNELATLPKQLYPGVMVTLMPAAKFEPEKSLDEIFGNTEQQYYMHVFSPFHPQEDINLYNTQDLLHFLRIGSSSLSSSPRQSVVTHNSHLDRKVAERLVARMADYALPSLGETLIVSPDSKHFMYPVQAGNKHFVIVDGTEHPRYDGLGIATLVFSPDSRHVAYVALTGNQQCVVVDGKGGHLYDGFKKGILFSSDSKRVAYIAALGDKQFVVIEGKEQKKYDGVFALVLSPDSRHFAYVAKSGERWFVVVDTSEGRRYDGIGEFTPVFSPDSRHVAYVAVFGGKYSVVIDGKEGRKYDGVGSPIFSPDSRHLAYRARLGNKSRVVIDGKDEQEYDHINELVFSPDSKHFVYEAQSDNFGFIVVDRNEGDHNYGSVVGGKIIFDTPAAFHYLSFKNGSAFLVEETIEDNE
ncbi:MAG: hypothetical protein Q8K98_08755 [Bacteroidota bacterium]|nr:hypothetical protein [Bacteroidota bacterium]